MRLALIVVALAALIASPLAAQNAPVSADMGTCLTFDPRGGVAATIVMVSADTYPLIGLATFTFPETPKARTVCAIYAVAADQWTPTYELWPGETRWYAVAIPPGETPNLPTLSWLSTGGAVDAGRVVGVATWRLPISGLIYWQPFVLRPVTSGPQQSVERGRPGAVTGTRGGQGETPGRPQSQR